MKSLFDLTLQDCRFIVAREEEQHMYCAEPRRDHNTSYCECHHARIFFKGRKYTAEEKQQYRARKQRALELEREKVNF